MREVIARHQVAAPVEILPPQFDTYIQVTFASGLVINVMYEDWEHVADDFPGDLATAEFEYKPLPPRELIAYIDQHETKRRIEAAKR